MSIKWNEEEDRLLLSLKRQELSWSEISDRMGRSLDGCKHRYSSITDNDLTEAIPTQQLFIETGRENRTESGWRDRIKIASQVKESRDNDGIFTNIARVKIATDRPYAMLVSSDWQLGGLGVDLQTWENHIEEFLNIDNMGMSIVGDMISNCYMHKTLVPVLSQVMSPEEQMRCVSDLLQEMLEKKKLLAITLSEEHDQRDARVTGMSAFRLMLEKMSVPFFNNRGMLVLEVGSAIYTIFMCHKSRFGSVLNELHTGNREARLSVPANVIISAHRHRPAMGRYPWFVELANLLKFVGSPVIVGGEVHVIQTGTYETESDFGQQFSALPDPPLQILVFDPKEHHIEAVQSFEAAKSLLKG